MNLGRDNKDWITWGARTVMGGVVVGAVSWASWISMEVHALAREVEGRPTTEQVKDVVATDAPYVREQARIDTAMEFFQDSLKSLHASMAKMAEIQREDRKDLVSAVNRNTEAINALRVHMADK
jgi:hypothetical protein